MIIKSAARLAFAAACLTAIGALATANAQPANSSGTASGSYWTSPAANGTPPGAYPAPETYTAPGTSGPATGTYTPQTQYAPPPTANTGGTEVMTNGSQGSSPPNWSANQNVRESERYTRLLEHNRAFREARMRKECGPITDPQLHQQCLASFAEDSPWAGSAPAYGSSSPTRYRSSYGR